MKIIFIISDLTGGGAEKILVNLANFFSDKNHEVYIITLSNNDSFYKLNDNINHIKLNLYKNSTSSFDKIFNNLKRVKELRNNIKNINPNRIVSFLTQTNITSILANIGLNIPIIISERSIYNSENNSKFWMLLRRLTYQYASYLIVLTEDDAKNYNFMKDKEVIPNFIKIDKENNIIKKDNIILAVGRLHSVKQFDLLISIYAKLKTDYKLYIVGDGPEKEKLQNLIKNLNLENKIFLEGQKKNVYEYYKRAKIFVLTSKHEAFPNVLLEALYFGCAIVSFDCDYGPRAILENSKNGFLVKNNDEFMEKVKSLIADDNLQTNISDNARNRVNHFEYNKVINQWKDLLENVKD